MEENGHLGCPRNANTEDPQQAEVIQAAQNSPPMKSERLQIRTMPGREPGVDPKMPSVHARRNPGRQPSWEADFYEKRPVSFSHISVSIELSKVPLLPTQFECFSFY